MSANYTAELKYADAGDFGCYWLRDKGNLVGIIELRATGWVARPAVAGRRASTKRWETAAAAARSMWGSAAARAIESVAAEPAPEPWDGPDYCGSGT